MEGGIPKAGKTRRLAGSWLAVPFYAPPPGGGFLGGLFFWSPSPGGMPLTLSKARIEVGRDVPRGDRGIRERPEREGAGATPGVGSCQAYF